MDHDSREDGRSKRISRRAGADWVKPHSTQHVPGRHLPGIVVTRQTTWVIVKLARKDIANAHLRLPRCAGEIVEIRDVVARLVALVVQLRSEEAIELGDESCVATDCLNKAGHVVRHEKGVLPGHALGDVESGLAGIEGLNPGVVLIAPTNKSDRRIEDVLPIAGAPAKCFGIRVMAERFCKLRGDEVVVGVLQRSRYLLVMMESVEHLIFERDKTVAIVRAE